MITIVITIVALILSLIAAFPIISRFLIYFFYKPSLDIYFPPPERGFVVKYSEIFTEKGETPLNIHNRDEKRDIQIEIEFVASKPVKIRSERMKDFAKIGLRGKLKGGFTFRTKPLYLPGYSTVGLSFPFEPFNEEYTLEITAHIRMKMSEFGFPIFFGEVNLKPIRKMFTVKP